MLLFIQPYDVYNLYKLFFVLVAIALQGKGLREASSKCLLLCFTKEFTTYGFRKTQVSK